MATLEAFHFFEDGLTLEDASLGTVEQPAPDSPRPESADSEEQLEMAIAEWKSFRKMQTGKNQTAYQLCCAKVNEITSKVIRGIDVQEICSYLSEERTDTMPVASLYAGLNASDNKLSITHACDVVKATTSPYIAVVGKDDCASIKHAVEAISSQLLHAIDATTNEAKKDRKRQSSALSGQTAEPRSKRLSSRRNHRSTSNSALRRPTADSSMILQGSLQSQNDQAIGIGSDAALLVGHSASIVTKPRMTPRQQRCDLVDVAERFRLMREQKQQQKQRKLPRKVDEARKGNERSLVVVVFEDAESIDKGVMCAVTTLLSRYHVNVVNPFRLGIILGLRSSSYQGAEAILTRRSLSLVRVRRFKPSSAKEMMDTLFQRLFLDMECPLHFSHKSCRWLSDLFMSCEFSIHAVLRAISLATVQHFTSHRAAFVGLAHTLKPASLEDLSPAEIASIAKLKSTKGLLQGLPTDKQRIEKIKGWIQNQENIRRNWPAVLQAVLLTRRALGHHQLNQLHMYQDTKHNEGASGAPQSATRAEFVDLLSDPKIIRTLRKALNTCSPEVMDRLMDDLIQGPFASSATAKKMREQYLVLREPSDTTQQEEAKPETQIVDPLSSKKKQRKVLRDHLNQGGQDTTQARKVFVSLWDKYVAHRWDARALPLGELYVFNQYKTIKSTFIAQPRSSVADALQNPHNASADSCLAYQILQGHGHKRTLPTLVWYKEFAAALDGGFAKPEDEETKARFIQAFGELEFLGVCASGTRTTDSVKLLIHSGPSSG